MKNILIFGAGEQGKQLISQYIKYKGKNKILAIADNNASIESYCDVPIIHPKQISQFDYDEIWVCTIHYMQIRKQLIEVYGIDEKKIIYVEPVMPLVDERIRCKYASSLQGDNAKQTELSEVLEYVKYNPARMYCYSFYDEYVHKDTPVYYDEDKKLYYALHHSKRMYFSKKMDTELKARSYYNSIIMEQDECSPHCYLKNKNINVAVSGIVVDVGAAEGVFALDIIDKAAHIYLIEVEEDWIEALTYTFEPYLDRITIVRKFVSDFDDEEHCRLDTLFGDIKVDCIKMDIEGAEVDALRGAKSILMNQNINLAICTYHHQRDNEIIGEYLSELGYQTENSKGYVLCQGDWELNNDEVDFRNAILFGYKN